MTRLIVFPLLVTLLLAVSAAYGDPGSAAGPLLTGQYWRHQALADIIPFWTPTIDVEGGGFFTDVDRKGTVGPSRLKYPRMISRLVYGFSVAFLLSGNEEYLGYARHGMDFLKRFGWDSVDGGWFGELDGKGSPTSPAKDLFDEAYGNTGPVMFYLATGDESALDLVSRVHALMNGRAWDTKELGYYAAVNRDWTVSDTAKSFNAQIDTATAYLLYDYLATRDPALLADLRRIADVAVGRMFDRQQSVIHERFDRQWRSIASYLGDAEEVDIGHNLKTAWVLLRVFQLTGERRYLDCARRIAATMLSQGWDDRHGGWFFARNTVRGLTTDHERSKCWWTQTEGNFLLLNLYDVTRDAGYLGYFQRSARFWDSFIVDHADKEVFPFVSESGVVLPGLKGDLYKSAYHTMENALMTYLYLELYVHRATADLYFSLSASKAGERHSVTLLEDPAVRIRSVQIDGSPWGLFSSEGGYVILPAGNAMKVKVTFAMAR